MGYTTDFQGCFYLDRPLTKSHEAYLIAFANTRRMKRNSELAAKRSDPNREAVGLPIGVDGEYFVGSDGDCGQEHSADVVDYNEAPAQQPGLWCQWIPSHNGERIIWDGNEKFYNYIEWLEYLIEHFLKPWGYVLSGSVDWRGEDFQDLGTIVVEENKVSSC